MILTKNGKSIFTRKVYIWLFLLVGAIVVVSGFTAFNTWVILKGGPTVKIEADSTYINAIILISGFLVAFSAISIYSIFNANVDRERDEIRILKDDLREKETQLDKKIEEWENKIQQAKVDTERFKQSEKELNDYINLVKSINDLTSPYSIDRKKSEAIFYFSEDYVNKNLNKDVKELILNFYNSLESNEVEKSKPYYKKLEDLLKQWGMID